MGQVENEFDDIPLSDTRLLKDDSEEAERIDALQSFLHLIGSSLRKKTIASLDGVDKVGSNLI